MEKHIEVTMEQCTGCKLCELACSAIKTGRFNPRDARIQVVLVGMPEIPVPILMDSCDYCGGHPACVQLCLPQAIVWKDLVAKPARPRLAEAKQIAERWLASVMQ